MAGLWESWTNRETQEKLFTFTIITTRANPMMEIIHNKKKRMPAILNKDNYHLWISKNISKEQTMSLLRPFDENEMEAYTISKLITVKDRDPNVPEVLEPFQYNSLEPLPSQTSLF